MTLAAPFAGVLSSYGIVAARLLLAALFLYSGQDKLRHWPASIREVAELGMPMPALFAASTIATQIAGGLSVALGFAMRRNRDAEMGALVTGLVAILVCG